MNSGEMLLKACDENPDERVPVLLLADHLEEIGLVQTAADIRKGLGFSFGYYGGDGYGGDGGSYGDGGGGYGGGGGDGDGYGGGGYGGGGGDGGYIIKYKLSRGYIMHSRKLYIVCSPGGYYPYVRIGWCEIVDGWVYLHNTRVIKFFGNLGQLSKIAFEGKIATTQLLEMSKKSNGLSIGMVTRFEECEPSAWVTDCPKPEGW